MTARAAGALLLLAGLVARAAAHTESPEAVVADLDGEWSRRAHGIEGVERDARNPRLLVVRVGSSWYALPPAARRDLAADWHRRWRTAVPQGVLAVLDARTAAPVVRFGAGGRVAGVSPPPTTVEEVPLKNH